MNTHTIKYIIFDLSEVLLTGLKDTGIALAEKHKLEIDPNDRREWASRSTPLLVPLVEEFFNGNIDEDEYIREVIERYPQIGEHEWLKEHIRDNFKEIEGTRDIVIMLKRLGYTLGLLSVHAREWVDHCEKKFDYHKLFDVRVYSYEVGVSKPDPMAFQIALDQLKASADECLFIDDSKHNINAAAEMGLSVILFTDADTLRMNLQKLLPGFD